MTKPLPLEQFAILDEPHAGLKELMAAHKAVAWLQRVMADRAYTENALDYLAHNDPAEAWADPAEQLSDDHDWGDI